MGEEVCDVGAIWLLLYGEGANPINLLIFERGGRGGILQCDAVVIKMSNIKQARVYTLLKICEVDCLTLVRLALTGV